MSSCEFSMFALFFAAACLGLALSVRVFGSAARGLFLTRLSKRARPWAFAGVLSAVAAMVFSGSKASLEETTALGVAEHAAWLERVRDNPPAFVHLKNKPPENPTALEHQIYALWQIFPDFSLEQILRLCLPPGLDTRAAKEEFAARLQAVLQDEHPPFETGGDGGSPSSGDGASQIPREWKNITHTLDYAGEDDPDGDGLTNLGEFLARTDPLEPDTDRDGFDDRYEIENGMNPHVKEDYAATEPDANNNGTPDIFDNQPQYLRYNAVNHDGFTGWYAECLEGNGNGTYDVWATVQSTRSAVLLWDDASVVPYSGMIFPAGKHTVRLRLPADSDTHLRLSAYPESFDEAPEQLHGELWAARLGVSLASPGGQSNFITFDNGSSAILKTVVLGEIRKHFAPPPRSRAVAGVSRTMTRNGGGACEHAEGPCTKLCAKLIGRVAYHANACRCEGSAIPGTYHAEDLVGIEPSEIRWSANCGTMRPATGGSSSLNYSSPPPGGEAAKTTATAFFDGTNSVSASAGLPPQCSPPCESDCCTRCPNFALTPNPLVVSWTETSATLNVTNISCAGASGGINWSWNPQGLDVTSTSDSALVFSPTNSTPGTYIVTAESFTHPNYSASANVGIYDIVAEPQVTILGLEDRKTLGVGEQVSLKIEPKPYKTPVWSCTAGMIEEDDMVSSEGFSTYYYAPSKAANATITAVVDGIFPLSVQYEIIEPSGWIVNECTPNNGIPQGICGSGASFELTITPTHVSFYNVRIMEVPSVATNAFGYFTAYPELFVHGSEEGAGEWSHVFFDNSCYDEVLMMNLKKPWSKGHLTWPIPALWKMWNDTQENTFPWSDQHFEIYENGDFAITKFGVTIKRDSGNNILTNSVQYIP